MHASASTGVRLAAGFRVLEPRAYRRVGGRDLELDLCVPSRKGGPWPTFVFFHGGGWITGARETVSLHLLPWMEHGWATVNVEYRLAREALAPAAVWDARHAARWVFDHAGEHGLDTERIVLGGFSSGAHLALLATLHGELPPASGEEAEELSPVRASAVVSWFGISDVVALLQGERPRAYARHWIGRRPDALELARALSPIHRVAPDTPPVVTIHGDRDPVVPFEQSVRFHEALDRAGVPNRLHVVAGRGHGDWDEGTWGRAYDAVFGFLENLGCTATGEPEGRRNRRA